MNLRPLAIAILIAVAPMGAIAQIVTNDPALNITQGLQLANQVKELANALEQLKTQQSMLDNMSGSSGYGSMLSNSNSTYKQNLPEDWGQVYSDAMNSSSALTGTANSLLGKFDQQIQSMPPADAMEFTKTKLREKGAYDRVMAENAYNNQMRELSDIQTLTSQIDSTTSSKQIQDLQARILTAQGAIQGESAKFQLMSMLQNSQDKMLQQQHESAVRRFTLGDDLSDNTTPRMR
ncbi:TPA: type IV secretion system protein [Pseudomonas putida]